MLRAIGFEETLSPKRSKRYVMCLLSRDRQWTGLQGGGGNLGGLAQTCALSHG